MIPTFRCPACRRIWSLYTGTLLAGCRLSPEELLSVLECLATHQSAEYAAAYSELDPRTARKVYRDLAPLLARWRVIRETLH